MPKWHTWGWPSLNPITSYPEKSHAIYPLCNSQLDYFCHFITILSISSLSVSEQIHRAQVLCSTTLNDIVNQIISNLFIQNIKFSIIMSQHISLVIFVKLTSN